MFGVLVDNLRNYPIFSGRRSLHTDIGSIFHHFLSLILGLSPARNLILITLFTIILLLAVVVGVLGLGLGWRLVGAVPPSFCQLAQVVEIGLVD